MWHKRNFCQSISLTIRSRDYEWQPWILNYMRTKGNGNLGDGLLPSPSLTSYTSSERGVLISHSNISTTDPVRERMWAGKREDVKWEELAKEAEFPFCSFLPEQRASWKEHWLLPLSLPGILYFPAPHYLAWLKWVVSNPGLFFFSVPSFQWQLSHWKFVTT